MKTLPRWNPRFSRNLWIVPLLLIFASLLLASPAGADAPTPSDADNLVAILGLSAEGPEDGQVGFAGVIGLVPPAGWIGDWIIGGEIVHVTPSTGINQENDTAVVGNWAAVLAIREEDGSYTALRIHILPPVLMLKGPINGIPPEGIGDWVIARQTIIVTEDTRIGRRESPAVVGTWAVVFARQQDEGLVASQLIVIPPLDHITLHGAIQRIEDGLWVVSGVPVEVEENTTIHGPAQVDLLATVKAGQLDDLSLLARLIAVDWREREGPGDPQRIAFRGEVESLPADGLLGDWLVAGRTVHVTENTEVDQSKGPVEVGAQVAVKGLLLADGTVLADTIAVLPPPEQRIVRFEGEIESLLPDGLVGIWTIAGREVEVTASTRIDEQQGEAVIGAKVAVVALKKNDGTLLALHIQVKGESGQVHVRFKGPIVRLPDGPPYLGIWVVGAQQVMVTEATEIDTAHGPIALGVWVEVVGVHPVATDAAQRIVLARKITVVPRPNIRPGK